MACTREEIQQYLKSLALELGVPITDPSYAAALDSRDPLAHFRHKFSIPSIEELMEGKQIAEGVDKSSDSFYFLGNSLGLPPKTVQEMMRVQLDKWAKRGIHGHREGVYPWLPIEDYVQEESARIVGAKPIEVAVMNALSVNVHLGMVTFYQPTPTRHKILCEKGAFPSDHYAMESQIRWHGYTPEGSLRCIAPREGERLWRTEDILKVIEEEGDSIALIHLSGIHFATGHVFDMKAITEAGHKKGCYVSFDLAHAAGNIELQLHDWGVDVATWCSYKYLNGGPGGLGGFFIHEKHAYNFDLPRFTGWWSHKRETRFVMNNVMELQPGAAGFQISNPPVFTMIPLIASLNIFKETSMQELTRKSRLLTGYLELLLENNLKQCTSNSNGGIEPNAKKTKKEVPYTIITSQNPAERGNQLSVVFNKPLLEISGYISKRGFQVDLRDPIMRIAPVPLYNKFNDVLQLYTVLCEAMEADTTGDIDDWEGYKK